MTDLADVEVREIYVGKSSKAEIKEYTDWVNKCYMKDQEEFPSAVISLDVVEIHIPIRDKLRMAKSTW